MTRITRRCPSLLCAGFPAGLAQLFTEHEISGDLLFQLDDKQLMAMGITKLGIRTKILLSISDLRNAEAHTSRTNSTASSSSHSSSSSSSGSSSSSSSGGGGALRGDIDRLRRSTNTAAGCEDVSNGDLCRTLPTK